MTTKVISYAAVTVTDYAIEHDGSSFLYREWTEADGNKLLDADVFTVDGEDLDDMDYDAKSELLEACTTAVEEMSQ